MIDPTGGPIPGAIEEAASRWFARRQRARDPASEASFERWMDQDSLHRIAYGRLEAAWQQSEILASGALAHNRKLSLAPFYLRPGAQRAALLVSAVLLLSIGFAPLRRIVAQTFSGAPAEAAFYRTGVGEIRVVPLSHGCSIVLDTQTLVRVRSVEHIVVESGRVRIVAPSAIRSLHVEVAGAVVVTGDATFDVDAVSQPARVSVMRGAIDVRVDHGSAMRVVAGTMLALVPGAARAPAQTSEARWVDGMLGFDATTLVQAIAAINRYNRLQIGLADPALGAKRISGAFKATDPDEFADALASIYQLDIDRSRTGQLIVKPRR